MKDGSIYSCKVSDVASGMTNSNDTKVTVLELSANVETLPTALLSNGSEAVLPCDFKQSTYGVYWTKQNGHYEPGGDTIVHLDTFFEVGERRGHGYDEGRFNISDDFSLIIANVEMKDGGRYSCKVSDVASGMTYSNDTDVTVFVYAHKPYVKINQCQHLGMHYGMESNHHGIQCTYDLTNNQTAFQLDCLVSGAKPNVSLTWMTNETDVGMNYNMTSKIVSQGDETFDQTVTLTGDVNQTPNGTVFTCVAEGVAVGGIANSSITLVKFRSELVQPNFPETQLKPNVAAIVVPILVLLAIIIAITIYIQKRSSSNQACHSSSRHQASPVSSTPDEDTRA